MKCKNKNEKNNMWKGDDVGYFALHAWIRRNKPKSEVCESCGKKKKLDAANISGKYKRDVNDFKWLCRKCHLESDERMKNNLKHFEKGNMIGFETRFKKKESFTSSEEVFKSHPEPKEKDKRLDMKEIDKLTGDLNG